MIQVNIGCINIKVVYQAGSVNVGTTLNFVQRPQPQGPPPTPPTPIRPRPRRPRIKPPKPPKPEPSMISSSKGD